MHYSTEIVYEISLDCVCWSLGKQHI